MFSLPMFSLPYELREEIISYLSFEQSIDYDFIAKKKYNAHVHTYNWALKNELVHVLYWFKKNKRPINENCKNLTCVKNEKIIEFINSINWDRNIILTETFEKLLKCNDLDFIKLLIDKSYTSPTKIYSPKLPDNILNWLCKNCIDWYTRLQSLPKNGIYGIYLYDIPYTSESVNLSISGDLYVGGDLYIGNNLHVGGTLTTTEYVTRRI